MLGFVRHDYKFIAPLHPPDPAQSAKPMECEPRASAGAKTPISRNRPVIGVGVVYVPDCKVQVFSSCKMAEYGHGIVQNYQRVIGNHVILDCNTQEILNLRVNGAVLSNKTANYDKSTVELPQHI